MPASRQPPPPPTQNSAAFRAVFISSHCFKVEQSYYSEKNGKFMQHAHKKVEKKVDKQNFLANLTVWSVRWYHLLSVKKNIAKIYEFCTLFLWLWKLPSPYRDSRQDTMYIAFFFKFTIFEAFWYRLQLICIQNSFVLVKNAYRIIIGDSYP